MDVDLDHALDELGMLASPMRAMRVELLRDLASIHLKSASTKQNQPDSAAKTPFQLLHINNTYVSSISAPGLLSHGGSTPSATNAIEFQSSCFSNQGLLSSRSQHNVLSLSLNFPNPDAGVKMRSGSLPSPRNFVQKNFGDDDVGPIRNPHRISRQSRFRRSPWRPYEFPWIHQRRAQHVNRTEGSLTPSNSTDTLGSTANGSQNNVHYPAFGCKQKYEGRLPCQTTKLPTNSSISIKCPSLDSSQGESNPAAHSSPFDLLNLGQLTLQDPYVSTADDHQFTDDLHLTKVRS